MREKIIYIYRVTTVENNIKYNNEIKENETIETIFLKVDFSKIKKDGIENSKSTK